MGQVGPQAALHQKEMGDILVEGADLTEAAEARLESFGAQAAPSQTTQEMCDVRKNY